jgi:hypothetical protein
MRFDARHWNVNSAQTCWKSAIKSEEHVLHLQTNVSHVIFLVHVTSDNAEFETKMISAKGSWPTSDEAGKLMHVLHQFDFCQCCCVSCIRCCVYSSQQHSWRHQSFNSKPFMSPALVAVEGLFGGYFTRTAVMLCDLYIFFCPQI